MRGQLHCRGESDLREGLDGILMLTIRIVTPISVSHTFIYEIFFSVWGEDDMGNPLPEPGPGGLRFLQVQRPVILPSCALIPRALDLPECKLPFHLTSTLAAAHV